MAAITEMATHMAMVAKSMVMPPFCSTYSDVTAMKAAQPFMLMVVHRGNTNRETRGLTPMRVSAFCIVTGNVAAELLVNRAIITAGAIALNTLTGFSPRAISNNGSTISIWAKLPHSTTNTYLPNVSSITPPDA